VTDIDFILVAAILVTALAYLGRKARR